MRDAISVFGGNSNVALLEEMCKLLRVKRGDAFVGRFSDGEIQVKIKENVRGNDVFAIQSTCFPSNDNLIELLILLDALKRASASRITAVLPYFGYARQDRKDQPRVPITAKLIANLLARAGASRVLTIDLHAGQIQGFFDIPLDHLFAINTFVEYFENKKIKNPVVVSPDVGGIKMARAYAKRLGANLAIVDKRRINDTKAEVMNIMGEVEGKSVVIVDDIIATAGSVTEAAHAVMQKGAVNVSAAITHAVLCGPAMERIATSPLKEVVVTNTIPIEESKMTGKVKVLTIAPLLANAIKRIHNEESISILFDE